MIANRGTAETITIPQAHYDSIVKTLLKIAHGRWYRDGKPVKSFSGEDCFEIARRTAIALDLDWSHEKPERNLHKRLGDASGGSGLGKVPPKAPKPTSKPQRGVDAFAKAGQGAF